MLFGFVCGGVGLTDPLPPSALRGCRGDSRPALFKNLNYFNIWCLKIARDQRVSLLATIIVFILAYERAGDRRALMHTEKHKLRNESTGVFLCTGVYMKPGLKKKDRRWPTAPMIPLECITVLFYVNRWLMRPSNCVWERDWEALGRTETDKEYRGETEG